MWVNTTENVNFRNLTKMTLSETLGVGYFDDLWYRSYAYWLWNVSRFQSATLSTLWFTPPKAGVLFSVLSHLHSPSHHCIHSSQCSLTNSILVVFISHDVLSYVTFNVWDWTCHLRLNNFGLDGETHLSWRACKGIFILENLQRQSYSKDMVILEQLENLVYSGQPVPFIHSVKPGQALQNVLIFTD